MLDGVLAKMGPDQVSVTVGCCSMSAVGILDVGFWVLCVVGCVVCCIVVDLFPVT